MRQKAYAAGTPIPGPEQDPDGWITLNPVGMSGEAFGAKNVEVECIVSSVV